MLSTTEETVIFAFIVFICDDIYYISQGKELLPFWAYFFLIMILESHVGA